MAIKKQVIIMSIIFDEEETYGDSAASAIDHRLFNEDGILEWEYEVIKEKELSTEITEEDLDKVKNFELK
ncbi:hypothetical protein [Lederbergia lenta]|uniref:hypothetical protein n=1 Tax=Lederbergia lenta TaxID=1467 RepID=UPI00203A542E|nr:hypothetical protein [Lederbergia lenta]MCM3109945.1 hypothetical protein [Lederbergia lenta]